MKRPDALWPRKLVHDTAHIFIPFAFAIFLLLLGGALLVSWGRLSNAVLVGFCVTAGILIGFFIICHLALYCTSAKEKCRDRDNKNNCQTSPHGSVLDARSVKLGSPRVCRSCLSGLSVHVPAVATFGGTTGILGVSYAQMSHERSEFNQVKLQPTIEEAPEEEDPDKSERVEQRSQELAGRNGRHDGQLSSSHSARPTQRKSQAGVEEELRIRSSRPMSHVSATVPPLNLGQHHRSSASGFYAFQNPVSPHPDSRGGPGILIQSLSEHTTRPALIANSVSSPAVLNNALLVNNAPTTPPQAEVQTRTGDQLPISIADTRTTSRDRNPPLPRTPPPRTVLTARQRAQQTAPKIGSPLRQSHQYVPYSPRDVGSPSRNRSRPPAFETHVVRFREPDLAGLIASGVIKVSPESHPPEWMLKYAPRFSSHRADIKIFDNFERKVVELRKSVDSIRRNRSRKAQVENIESVDGRRYYSNDSGYCTASSGLISTSPFGKISPKHGQDNPTCILPFYMPAWGCESSASPEGERSTLRRRSSVPELSSRFMVEKDNENWMDDESN